MKQLLLFVLVLLINMTSQAASARSYVVAPNGRDSNPGTERKPFATLERARDEIRRQKTKWLARPHTYTVWVRGGNYVLKKSFDLDIRDSGLSNAPVVYRAFKQEQPCFIGGIDLPTTAFHHVTDKTVLHRLDVAARTNVLQIDLRKLGVNELGAEWPKQFVGYNGWPELFYNGKPMHLARWPNSGFARMGNVVDAGSRPRYGEKPDRPGKFIYSGDRPERWTGSEEVFLDGYWSYKWYNECLKVDKIDTTAKTILFAAPHLYGVGGPSGGDFYALNLLEELDAPEEYYLDRKTGILYFWPPNGTANSPQITLSLLQNSLLTLSNVSNVTIEGLQLEASRGGAVDVRGGHDVLLTNCVVRNVASDAVNISGGKHNGIAGCEIYEVGAAGISLDGGDRTNLVACGNFAENNHIHHFARLVRTHKDALFLSGCGCRAAHNLIHDAPHHAVDFNGNDHVIEFNEIHHVCQETDDAGAIYNGRHWSVQGNIIRYNFIHEIGHGGGNVGNQAIYLDDCASGTTCYGNVISHAGRAFLVGGGRDNVIRNNLLIDCPVSVYFDNRGIASTATHAEDWSTLSNDLKSMPYKGEPWKSRYPYLSDYLENRPGYPLRNVIEDNLIVRCGDMQLAAEVRQFGTIGDNLELKTDPGFADAAHLDYALKEEAAAYKELPNFKPIPFKDIGLNRSPGR